MLKFVLQASNWHDLENFVKLCMHYKFKGHVSKLENWGSFTDPFSNHDILDTKHPDHLVAMTEIHRVLKQYLNQGIFWVDPAINLLYNTFQPRE